MGFTLKYIKKRGWRRVKASSRSIMFMNIKDYVVISNYSYILAWLHVTSNKNSDNN